MTDNHTGVISKHNHTTASELTCVGKSLMYTLQGRGPSTKP